MSYTFDDWRSVTVNSLVSLESYPEIAERFNNTFVFDIEGGSLFECFKKHFSSEPQLGNEVDALSLHHFTDTENFQRLSRQFFVEIHVCDMKKGVTIFTPPSISSIRESLLLLSEGNQYRLCTTSNFSDMQSTRSFASIFCERKRNLVGHNHPRVWASSEHSEATFNQIGLPRRKANRVKFIRGPLSANPGGFFKTVESLCRHDIVPILHELPNLFEIGMHYMFGFCSCLDLLLEHIPWMYGSKDAAFKRTLISRLWFGLNTSSSLTITAEGRFHLFAELPDHRLFLISSRVFAFKTFICYGKARYNNNFLD
jgi:hypothetical protein